MKVTTSQPTGAKGSPPRVTASPTNRPTKIVTDVALLLGVAVGLVVALVIGALIATAPTGAQDADSRAVFQIVIVAPLVGLVLGVIVALAATPQGRYTRLARRTILVLILAALCLWVAAFVLEV